MKIGFQIDSISSLNFKTDSTIPIILESQKRGNNNFCFLPSSLTFRNNSVFASAREIYFENNKTKNYSLGKVILLKLNLLDFIFIRQDPPYDMQYISRCIYWNKLKVKQD